MEIKNGKEKLTRLNRLIKSFSTKMQEVYLNFLHGALPNDLIIYLMYDALFDTLVSLLSQFMSQQIVTQYKNSEISDDEIRILVNDEENHLSRNHLYVGFIVKTQVKKLLDDGDITKIRYDMVFNVCLIFHVFLYVLENFLSSE